MIPLNRGTVKPQGLGRALAWTSEISRKGRPFVSIARSSTNASIARWSASRSNSSFFCASVARLLINAQSTAFVLSFSKSACLASPLLL
jgi:hypothetical protein